MWKYQLWQTVDCGVGGSYDKRGTQTPEYRLMGLYDEAGRWNDVGRWDVGENAAEIGKLPKTSDRRSGFFCGTAPGGPSRWSSRERKPIPLQTTLVAEVGADHIENGRFRHGTRLILWCDD